MKIEERGVGGDGAEAETEPAKVKLGEANWTKRRGRGGEARLAAMMDLIVFGRGESDDDVVADELEMASSELAEAGEAAQCMVYKNNTK